MNIYNYCAEVKYVETIKLNNGEEAYQNKYMTKRGHVFANNKDEAISRVQKTYCLFDEVLDIYVYDSDGVFETSSK